MKIKITEKETEIEGKLEPGRVTPFGSSAHIIASKKHTGKIVKVVVPDNPKYTWLLSVTERKSLLDSARKNIEKENGRLEHLRMGVLKELEGEEFELDSLIKVLDFVDNKVLVKKVKSLYNLK